MADVVQLSCSKPEFCIDSNTCRWSTQQPHRSSKVFLRLQIRICGQFYCSECIHTINQALRALFSGPLAVQWFDAFLKMKSEGAADLSLVKSPVRRSVAGKTECDSQKYPHAALHVPAIWSCMPLYSILFHMRRCGFGGYCLFVLKGLEAATSPRR